MIDSIQCKLCGIELTKENSTKISNLKRCRECYNASITSNWRKRQFESKYWGDEVPQYSPHQVKPKPGVFIDDEQKKHVHDLLYAIGWKLNEKKNIWYDDKIKDKDGNWLVDTSADYHSKRQETKWRRLIGGDETKIPRVKPYNRVLDIDEDTIRHIQILYFIKNHTSNELVEKYGYSNVDWVIKTTMKKIRILYNE